MSARGLAVAATAILLCAPTARAQSDNPFTFYYQNVPLWSDETELSDGGFGDFNRFRVMTEPTFGDFTAGIAYEQVLTTSQDELAGISVGIVPSGGEWLDLQWEIVKNDTLTWAHRFDRAYIGWAPTGSLDLRAGRQAVSWATTLFLTPADPFSPFDPADPFREFRAGVDAVRMQVFPGPLSQLDVVVRGTKTELDGEQIEELTALGRGLSVWKNWELSGWGGSLYGDVAGSGAAAGSIGASAVRGEAVLRGVDGDLVFRGTIGFDHRFSPWSRDLFVVVEYQRDGFGAAKPDEYPEVFESDAFRRGELQVAGRDEIAVQANYQLHPLWSLSGLWLLNANDPSSLLSPSFAYSASDNATVTGGMFFGFGDDNIAEEGSLPSEYGLVGTTIYFSMSVFF